MPLSMDSTNFEGEGPRDPVEFDDNSGDSDDKMGKGPISAKGVAEGRLTPAGVLSVHYFDLIRYCKKRVLVDRDILRAIDAWGREPALLSKLVGMQNTLAKAGSALKSLSAGKKAIDVNALLKEITMHMPKRKSKAARK